MKPYFFFRLEPKITRKFVQFTNTHPHINNKITKINKNMQALFYKILLYTDY